MTAAPTPLRRRRLPGRDQLGPITAVILVIAVIVLVLLLHYGVFESSATSIGVRGSGIAASQARVVPPFDRVELSGANDVIVDIGAPQSVVVRADDNLLARVTTQVHDGTLVVGNTQGSFTTKAPMKVEISVPSLETLRLSGSGTVNAGGIEASELSVSLSGSGVVRVSGRVTNLHASLGGSGDLLLEELNARHADVAVSGSGLVYVTATKSLDASIPGTGTIVYGGFPPDVTKSVSGSGAIVAG